jgi:hypothetical protein
LLGICSVVHFQPLLSSGSIGIVAMLFQPIGALHLSATSAGGRSPAIGVPPIICSASARLSHPHSPGAMRFRRLLRPAGSTGSRAVARLGTAERDSPVEGARFEPLVPLTD